MNEKEIVNTLNVLNTQLQQFSSDHRSFQTEYVVIAGDLLHQTDTRMRMLLPPGEPCPHCSGTGVKVTT